MNFSMTQAPFRIIKRSRDLAVAIRAILEHPLHRGQRLSSLTRWARLRVARGLTPTGEIAVPFVEGSMLTGATVASDIGTCARYALFEYGEMAFTLHLLRPNDLFCDIGANAGAYTVLAAHATGSSVIALEPVPKTFNVLMQNIYMNNLSARVEAKPVGVGRTPSKLHFTLCRDGKNHVVETPDENTVEAEVLPLDTVLSGRVPLMIKIDVEGFEGEVLAGAKETLRNAGLQAVLIEMWEEWAVRYGGSLEALVTTLKEAGLSGPYWYDPTKRELIEPGRVEWAKRNYNGIFIRDIDFVKARLAQAKQYEVNGALI